MTSPKAAAQHTPRRMRDRQHDEDALTTMRLVGCGWDDAIRLTATEGMQPAIGWPDELTAEEARMMFGTVPHD